MPVAVSSSAESSVAERPAHAVLGKNRRHQFQIANRYGVQHQRVRLLVIPHAVEMPQRRAQNGSHFRRPWPKFRASNAPWRPPRRQPADVPQGRIRPASPRRIVRAASARHSPNRKTHSSMRVSTPSRNLRPRRLGSAAKLAVRPGAAANNPACRGIRISRGFKRCNSSRNFSSASLAGKLRHAEIRRW